MTLFLTALIFHCVCLKFFYRIVKFGDKTGSAIVAQWYLAPRDFGNDLPYHPRVKGYPRPPP
jgi:hypothetical protein